MELDNVEDLKEGFVLFEIGVEVVFMKLSYGVMVVDFWIFKIGGYIIVIVFF